MSKEYSIKDIVIALVPFFMVLILEMFFNICCKGVRWMLDIQTNALIFDMIFAYLIYGILFASTKKMSTATIIFSIFVFLLLAINQIKLAYTGEPIYFSDINFISNIDNLFGIVENNISKIIKLYIITFLIMGGLYFFIIFFVKRNERTINNIKARLIILISSIVILIILFVPNKYTKNLFLNIFLNLGQHKDYAVDTTNISYYTNHSMLAGMYGVLLNNYFEEPENYNEEELINILCDENINNMKGEWGKPNIIVVFSESFWDINRQSDVKFDKDVTPNISRLKKEGKFIETISCSYGGMSENVAFELLTGGSLNYFTKGYIPIMSLYKNENSKNIPSIVKELKNNGYRSKIVFGKDYYNSEKSMKKIGFDEYVELKGKKDNIKGKFISDNYITDVIINELENKTEEKIFCMAETIQNHMPYTLNKYDKYDIGIEESNLSKEMNDAILSYAQGVYDADKELNRLYEYIKTYEEPTILIFLGDHLPYLYTKTGENAIDKLSYFNTDNDIENLYRKYNTQTLILSNYDINLENLPNFMSNNNILTYIANNLDIQLSSYYRWLYSTIEDLPASNSYISIDLKGNKYSTEQLENNMKRIYKLRENMQYKFFIKVKE